MQFDGFEWDRSNIGKCQKHGVSVEDIEDLFLRRVLIVNDPHDAEIERRFRVIGTTPEGRAVFVVFTLPEGPHPPHRRPLHASKGRRAI